ncbi:unnamed protein product [Auanema sp. JU1783]|nr:unnamed protein product [Auanema sp. JU1783]
MSRFLITGGSGLIGSAITNLLLQDETTTVVILDKNSPASPHPSERLHFVTGDFTNSELLSDILKQFDINRIIDCVSQSRKSVGVSPRLGAQIALQGLTNLLDVVRENGRIESIVLLSNQAVYGREKQVETAPLAPITFFGAALMGAEAMLHSYVISYKLPAAIARLSEGIIEYLPRDIENLSNPVNLITARNAAAAIIKISSVAQNGRIYNVGGPNDYDLSALKKALSSAQLSVLKESETNSLFSTERLRNELDFIIQNDFDNEFESLVIDTENNNLKNTALLFSEKATNLPSVVSNFVTEKKISKAESSPGYDDDDTVKKEIIHKKPTIVLWVANPKENIEAFEGGPDALKKNMNEHLLGPWLVSSYCHTMGIKFVFVSLQDDVSENTSFQAVKTFVKPLLSHFPNTIYLNSSTSTFEKDVSEHIKL